MTSGREQLRWQPFFLLVFDCVSLPDKAKQQKTEKQNNEKHDGGVYEVL